MGQFIFIVFFILVMALVLAAGSLILSDLIKDYKKSCEKNRRSNAARLRVVK